MHRMLVKDLMQHPVITVVADAPIADAAQLMEEYDIRRLPVVDEEGSLIGIVTETDIRAADAADSVVHAYDPSAHLRWLTVGEIMTEEPTTIGPDSTVGELVNLFLQMKFGGIPVVADSPQRPRCKELVGIVTEMDIFRMIAESWAREQQDADSALLTDALEAIP